MAIFEHFKEDVKRYLPKGSRIDARMFLRLLMKQTLYAIAIYRFGHWISFKAQSRLLRFFLKPFYVILNKLFLEILLGLNIPAQCDIGPGLSVAGNFLGLVINPNTRIGKNCTLGHGVVIGTAADGTPIAPSLGDNVFIGAGAVLLGGIEVGDNVKIGANSVVNKNIPSNVTAAGVPARIVKHTKEMTGLGCSQYANGDG